MYGVTTSISILSTCHVFCTSTHGITFGSFCFIILFMLMLIVESFDGTQLNHCICCKLCLLHMKRGTAKCVTDFRTKLWVYRKEDIEVLFSYIVEDFEPVAISSASHHISLFLALPPSKVYLIWFFDMKNF